MNEKKDIHGVNKSNINDISDNINNKRNHIFNINSFDSSTFSSYMKRKSTEIESSNSLRFFQFNYEDFSAINPFRDVKNKRKITKLKPLKEKAIIESVVNLKIQYILYSIKDFVRKYQIKNNPQINHKLYKSLVVIRNICLLVYGIIMLFEKPWFCHEKATLPLPNYFNFTRNCDNVAFLGTPFMNTIMFRIIEIFINVIFFIVQLFKYKNEFLLKETNIGFSKLYNIIQIILFVSLILCIIDLIISLCTGYFPIINFILRAFIFIYMIRRIRRNWIRIGKILWRTKTVFLILFMNIILFSAIGYFLYKKGSSYFESFLESVLQLYILLSTCNFPDIMIETFNISKSCIFYFIIYISINYFIILSYLKTLYYTKYYLVNKEDCVDIIKDIIQNKVNQDIFKTKQFKKHIYKLKFTYSLNDDEYNNILVLLNIYGKNNDDIFKDSTKIVEKTPEEKMISSSLYGKYILNSKVFEIIISFICIITILIARFDYVSILSIQFVWSFCLLFELYSLIKNLGLNRFIFHHFNRVIFHIFNLVVIICIVYLIVLDENKENKTETYTKVFKTLKIFISLRAIRIFVFLDKFIVIKNIYSIIRNSKEMFYRNIFTLYSLFLLFSTFSMLLTGGNIEIDSFDNNKVDSIPEDYAYINFNDLPSSFITCFCLLMINNLNILVNSLTYHINSHKIAFQFYFATFYFFSTLIIINIIQTLLLELYLISDYSFSNSEKKEELTEEEEEEEEDDDDKMIEM